MIELQTPILRGETLEEVAGLLLVVDDEPFNLDILSRRLTRSGFSVMGASSGREALEMIAQHSFDLVLLDQMMPEMSGTEVLQSLRANPVTQTLPVIMVTAVAASERISEAFDNGVNDYITKPVDFKIALSRIRSQLARRRAEAALRKSEERYALVARAAREGLWDWNLPTGEMYFSPRWHEMLGLNFPVDNTAEAWFSRIVKSDRETIEDEIQAYLIGSSDVLQCSYRMRHEDGTSRWMSCHAVMIRNAEGVPIRMVGAQSDLTSEMTTDALTGLPNRLALLSQLELVLENTRKNTNFGQIFSKNSYAVLFLDLNDFKTVNDSLGHAAGDQLLILVAARLRQAGSSRSLGDRLAHPPLVARMGGDEIAVLLQGAASLGEVMSFASEVQELMDEPFVLGATTVHCAFSIGAALANVAHRSPEDILREADIAMYITKVENRGRIAVFDPSMREIVTEQIELENDIRFAVAKKELVVVYQPKVELDTGLTYGVEALVRWNHPKRGLLQPGIFIPIAEKTGVIVEMGRWILREACLQVRSWHKEFSGGVPLELSVNLSPREFKQKNLIEEVKQTLLLADFAPSLLHLEVTEGALFEDIATARDILYALKQTGIGLDLDDFGSGYSSLRYLRELPFDSLKIDRYFVASLDPDQPASAELIGTILSMAKTLGLKVIAEGIETLDHRATLEALGCHLGQGYLFGKPMSSVALADLLRAERMHALPSVLPNPALMVPPAPVSESI